MNNASIKTLLKVLASLIFFAAIALAALVALVIASLSGAPGLEQGLIVATAALAALAMLALVWRPFARKARLISLAAAFCALALCWGGVAVYRVYDASFEQMADQEDYVWLYDPFFIDTKAAKLNEPAALKLTDNLPKLDGATALYPVYAAFVRAVYAEELIGNPYHGDRPYDGSVAQTLDSVLACTRTGSAYERLIAGEADVIFVAGPSERQIEMAREAGVELELTPIGREAFVFFVSAENPVNGLTVEQIRRIYSGEVTNWRELGGKRAKIKAYQRPENSGSQTALVGLMGDTPLANAPTEDVAGMMGGIITRVALYKNYGSAIGYSFLFYATEMVKNDAIKLLELNGVAPTRENIVNGTYPYASEFYAVTAGTQNPHVQGLIDWICSPQGQYLVEKTGYTPIS